MFHLLLLMLGRLERPLWSGGAHVLSKKNLFKVPIEPILSATDVKEVVAF